MSVCIPNYNWNNKEYEENVVEPYTRIKSMKKKLRKEDREPKREEIREAIEMFNSICINKKISKQEKMERFNQLFDETKADVLFPEFINKLK